MSLTEEAKNAVVDIIKGGGDIGSALIDATAKITDTAIKGLIVILCWYLIVFSV